MPPNRGSRYECLSPAVSLASCVVLKSASDIEQILIANPESAFENVVMESTAEQAVKVHNVHSPLIFNRI